MKKTVRKIVAIGGGEIRRGDTFAIDQEIVRLSGKKNPKFLFLPTASSDSEMYWKNIGECYGRKLGCKTDVLFLLKEKPSFNVIESKILGADIIYVGGGNTLKMMNLWRRFGIDDLLKAAWKKGTVLCGISAGAICWFDSGHSDSMSFYHSKKWNYINVRGLGFIKGIHCPHFDGATLKKTRKNEFKKMIGKVGGMGIALDNYSALEFLDDQYRVITSKKGARAYRVYKKGGHVVVEEIPQIVGALPVKNLYKR